MRRDEHAVDVREKDDLDHSGRRFEKGIEKECKRIDMFDSDSFSSYIERAQEGDDSRGRA
jgi:hypothetical protein